VKKGRIKKFFKMLIFIIYILALIYFMFFAEILGRTDVVTAYRYNLVPLKEIKRFLYYHRQLGLAAVIANLAGNVIAFMPFGFCLPLVFGHRVRFIQCVLYTFGLSLAIEITQLLCKVGTFDVDDLILNTLGGILGFAVFVIYRKIHSGKLQH
jgi:glycopeptide antibiotics resistance protein